MLKRKRSGSSGTGSKRARPGTPLFHAKIPKTARFLRSSTDYHVYKRGVHLASHKLTAGTGDTSFGAAYELDDLPNISELSALYDQYKILKVELMFVPSTTTANQQSPYDCTTIIWIMNDFDDDSAPADLSSILQSARAVPLFLTKDSVAHWSCRPRPSIAGTAAAGGGVAVPTQSTWMDMGNTATKHFGTKFVARRLNPTGLDTNNPAWSFDVYATYTIACKGTR